jgi:hypothetical protein
MKKFFTAFFVSLGVIFFLIILFIFYLFIFDPFNIKPLLFNEGETFDMPQNNTTESGTTTTANKPFLSDAQKKTLTGFGVDPASLPSSITPTQEACFKSKLGESRFTEISAGASPSAIEFLNAKSCL